MTLLSGAQTIQFFVSKLGRYPWLSELTFWEAQKLARADDWQLLFEKLYAQTLKPGRTQINVASNENLWIDVTETANYPYQTGIQRVVREFIAHAEKENLRIGLFTVDLKTGQPYQLPIDQFLGQKTKKPVRIAPKLLGSFRKFFTQVAIGTLRLMLTQFRNSLLVPLSHESKLVKKLLVHLDRVKTRVRSRISNLLLLTPTHDQVLIFNCNSRVLLLEQITDSRRGDLYTLLNQFGVAITLGVHDLLPLEYPQFVADAHGYLQHLRILRVANRIATYPGVEKKLCSLLDALSLPSRPVRGFSPGGAHSNHDSVSRGLLNSTPTQSAPLILCVGTFEPRKNQELLLLAAMALEEKKIPFELVLIGQPGWKNDNFYSLAHWLRENGRLTKFKVIEAAPEALLQQYYQRAHLVVIPSYGEGYGLPILEGLLKGKKVLASNRIPLETFRSLTSNLVSFDPSDLSSFVELLCLELQTSQQQIPPSLDPKILPSWQGFARDLYNYAKFSP